MRICLGLAMIIITMSSMYAVSAPFPVQTGDHESFTRLVILAEDGVSWTARREATRVVVSVENNEDGFETGSVFDRIGKNRINIIESEKDTLEIGIACECQISTFLDSGRNIVIDISEFGSKINGQILEISPLAPPSKPPEVKKTRRENVSNNENIFKIDSNLNLTNFQDRLTKNLGHLGTTKILNSEISMNLVNSNVEPVNKSYEILPRNLGVENNNILLPNFTEALLGVGKPDVETMECHDARHLSFKMNTTTDASSGPFEGVVDLTNDAGDIDIDRAIHHARELISLGMGAEANQILSLIKRESLEIKILSAISDILEYGTSSKLSAIQESSECVPDLLFWSILGSAGSFEISNAKLKQSLLYFNELPPSLRKSTYRQFLENLRRSDNPSAVPAILENLDRLSLGENLGLKIEKISNKIYLDETDDVNTLIKELKSDQAILESGDFIKVIDAKLRLEGEISKFDMVILDSLIFQETDTSLLDMLYNKKFFALLGGNMFLDALNLLEEVDSLKKPEHYEPLLHDATLKGNDRTFLEIWSSVPEQLFYDLRPETQRSLKDRLLELGFSSLSQASGLDTSQARIEEKEFPVKNNSEPTIYERFEPNENQEVGVSIGYAKEILAESRLRRLELENLLQ